MFVFKNSKSWKSMAAVMTLVGALGSGALVSGCAGPNTMEKTGVFIDDSVITTKVKALLVDDTNVSATEVSVTTSKGRVQLSGFVGTDAEIERAEMIASSVEGVVSVDNALKRK